MTFQVREYICMPLHYFKSKHFEHVAAECREATRYGKCDGNHYTMSSSGKQIL